MEERREINRIEFRKKSVIVVCETEEKIYVDVKDVSPLGMGIIMPAGSPDLVGKDIIKIWLADPSDQRRRKVSSGSRYCDACRNAGKFLFVFKPEAGVD